MMSTHQLVSGSSWVRMELSILSVCASLCSSSFSWFSVQIHTHKRNKNTICELLTETKYICIAWDYVAPYVWPKKIHICKQKPIHTRYTPASTDFLAPFVNFSFCAWSSADLICESKKEQNPLRWCTYWSIQSSDLFCVPSGTCMPQTRRRRWRRGASAWTRSPCCCWFCTCRSSALAPSASSSAACSRGSGVNRGHSRWWAGLSLRPGPYLLLQRQHDEHQEGERFWEYCEERGWLSGNDVTLCGKVAFGVIWVLTFWVQLHCHTPFSNSDLQWHRNQGSPVHRLSSRAAHWDQWGLFYWFPTINLNISPETENTASWVEVWDT